MGAAWHRAGTTRSNARDVVQCQYSGETMRATLTTPCQWQSLCKGQMASATKDGKKSYPLYLNWSWQKPAGAAAAVAAARAIWLALKMRPHAMKKAFRRPENGRIFEPGARETLL